MKKIYLLLVFVVAVSCVKTYAQQNVMAPSLMDSLKIYPTVSNDGFFTIETLETINITALSIIGVKVGGEPKSTGWFENKKITLDLSSAQKGLYFIVFKNRAGETRTKKVIIN